MNAPFKTATRLGRFHSVAGADVLALLRFDGTDGVNELFDYTVEALAATPHIDFEALIGTHATVELLTQHHGSAYYDGIVTHAQWNGVGENGHTYRLTLRPWFWLAGRRRNQRIFHEMTVVDILR
ncbi:MAG: contractile injection system protein, VgrG/Pvc8 family, partial [Pseudomonadota bacterium]